MHRTESSFTTETQAAARSAYFDYCNNSGWLSYRGTAALKAAGLSGPDLRAPSIEAADETSLLRMLASLGIAAPSPFSAPSPDRCNKMREAVRSACVCPGWDDLTPEVRANWCAAVDPLVAQVAGQGNP